PCPPPGPAAALGPPDVGKAMTDARNVHDAFSRFVSAVATASAIAVSVATLTLGRDLKGLRTQAARREANDAYRERVREASGLPRAPLALPGFLALAARNVQEAARAARRAAAGSLDARAAGVPLGAFLDALEAAAGRTARELAAAGRHPNRVAERALDVEEEATTQLLRGYRRLDGLSPEAQRRLADLEEAVADLVLGAKYAKTMDVQWGFSRMAIAITTTSLPAIVVATLMVLAYGQGAVDALGATGAAALVAGAFGVVLLPLACFASYILRFVFLHQHTLPTDAFVLGPEEPDAVASPRTGRRTAG
ncbi:MAG TPA: hypothetical protein VNX21_02500, partial [Candidatus Thermoplasmatota archaeon]|nr:hypothetical protein [Candidatus Thermoplasmatota archaeon]